MYVYLYDYSTMIPDWAVVFFFQLSVPFGVDASLTDVVSGIVSWRICCKFQIFDTSNCRVDSFHVCVGYKEGTLDPILYVSGLGSHLVIPPTSTCSDDISSCFSILISDEIGKQLYLHRWPPAVVGSY